METNTMDMFAIDAYDLDVEELEERLEFAAAAPATDWEPHPPCPAGPAWQTSGVC